MRALHNKTILLGSVIGLSFLMLSTMAHADNGITATGTQLPIGTSAGTVLTITGGGTTGDSSFTGTLETSGNATFGGSGSFSTTLTVGGVGNILGGLEIGTEGNGGFVPVGTPQFGPMLSLGGATTNNSDPIYFQRYNENADTTSLRLVIGDNAGSPYVPGAVDTTADGDAFIIGSLNSANNYVWVPNFTFTSNGFLGIGTTTPLATLHVVAPALNNNATGILVESSSTTYGSPRIGLIDTSLGADTVAPAWYIDNDSDNFRIFRQSNYNTAGVASVEISNTGNVGVDTPTPKATLDVNGEVKIANTGVECVAANAGSIRWANGTFQGCNGSAWTVIASGKYSAGGVDVIYEDGTGTFAYCRLAWGAAVGCSNTGAVTCSSGTPTVTTMSHDAIAAPEVPSTSMVSVSAMTTNGAQVNHTDCIVN